MFIDKCKIYFAIAYDFLCAYVAIYLSVFLRTGSLDYISRGEFHLHYFISAVLQFVGFIYIGLYRGIWRFSSTPDLVRVIKGSFLAMLSLGIYHLMLNRSDFIPRSSIVIDMLFLIVFLGGGRFLYRIIKDRKLIAKTGVKCLIIGAGGGGERLCREIVTNPLLNLKVLGFLDDSKYKRNKFLHNRPVLGSISEMKEVVKEYNIEKVFICIPSASPEKLREIVNMCIESELIFKILPSSVDNLRGKGGSFNNLRDVSPEDLLSRQSIDFSDESINKMISGRTVMVTGSGGSIGSELCRQIINFKPDRLVCFDISEFNLYSLEMDLNARDVAGIEIIYIIGDIRDSNRINYLVSFYRPNSIFHAAAYKHVPLMENNPYEAFRTNVLGTRILVNSVIENKVSNFVLVSSDKAVNPTNVMGATKRIAELLCTQAVVETETKSIFSVVRFGNVLGSSGSVVPLFKKQIAAGGPITVTHADITRYFMSIPEASQLVLKAGAIGTGGDVFVLDMGKPFKIIDIAKQLIRLSGLIPDKDIEIKITGLRPGEKLYEELFLNHEQLIKTEHPKILKSNVEVYGVDLFKIIEKICQDQSASNLREQLKEIVPEYNFRLH